MLINKNLQTCFLLSGKATVSVPSVTQTRDPAESLAWNQTSARKLFASRDLEACAASRWTHLRLLRAPCTGTVTPTRPQQVLLVKAKASASCSHYRTVNLFTCSFRFGISSLCQSFLTRLCVSSQSVSTADKQDLYILYWGKKKKKKLGTRWNDLNHKCSDCSL